MAFNPANFSNEGSSTVFSYDGSNNQFRYTTTDSLATIDADTGYFNSMGQVLRKKDYILVTANGDKGVYAIDAVSPSSPYVSFLHLF